MGPVGGSLENPPGFADDTAPWFVRLRSLDRLRLRRDPLLRHTYEGADCVLGIAPYIRDDLAGLDLRRFEVMSEIGLTELPPLGEEPRPPDRAVRLLCWQPRERVAEFYRRADAFVFPSYREPGGNVVFESMGYGLPLVVSDLGGPGTFVDDSCGIRVHPENPERYADALAVAISRLVDDPALRTRLREAGRRRVAEIAVWDRKVEQLEALYDELLPTQSGTGALVESGFAA